MSVGNNAGPIAHRGSPDLNRDRRSQEFNQAAESVSDVLVIGGGITGVGVALDAASRGLSVTLVEAKDLAYGTSRWSSKLVHGGLRYLAHGDFAVAWESARERALLMGTIAPHLIRPLPHVLPTLTTERRGQEHLVRAGLRGSDLLRQAARTPAGLLANSRRLSTPQMQRIFPTLDPKVVRAGSGFWDGQLIDDARLVIAVARTAASFGARILTRVQARSVDGRHVAVRDQLSGETTIFTARQVIVAAGVWSGNWADDLSIRLSRGTHVILPPAVLGNPRAALTVAVPGEKSRYVFALPTIDGSIIAGLTDSQAPAASADQTSPPVDEQLWVLEQLSAALRTPLRITDVIGAYSGYRPLVDSGKESGSTADISRRHLVHHRKDGVIVITGGKLTTYRRMAADALNASSIAAGRPCVTSSIPLIGASGTDGFLSTSARLISHYGDEAGRIEHDARTDPVLAGTFTAASQVWRAEVAHAIRREGALTVDDIVARRTRLAVESRFADARAQVSQLAVSLDSHMITVEVDQ
jgi:glycerol-3-phosphate dehydrogenase